MILSKFAKDTTTYKMRIAIIGAGAAGCFAAINIKRKAADAEITVFESGRKPLAKVAVTGGGRCNITNSFEHVKSMAAVYPRGHRLMERLFHMFDNKDTCRWFEAEGVRFVTQEDGCVFPKSQDAMEIVGTLARLMNNMGIRLITGHRITRIEKAGNDNGNGFRIYAGDSETPYYTDIAVVTTGGCPKAGMLDMLAPIGVKTVSPVPSLFGLCLPGDNITALTGTVVENASVAIAGTKHRAEGDLLITHRGVSGPAILRLSSYAARTLHDNDYRVKLTINWMGAASEAEVQEELYAMAAQNPQKQISNIYPTRLNARLWTHLLLRCGIKPEQRWSELARKSYNKLTNVLTNSTFDVDGRNKFKEEFVTCGGVALSNVNPNTLECKSCPGLFFAGEVLDVDALTGGFNLQAAWTMGYVVAEKNNFSAEL